LDSSVVPQIVALIVLLLLSAFFSSSETALTTVNRIRVRSLVEEGNKRAVIVSKLIEDSGKMLSAILIGNNVVNLSASSLSTTIAISIWGNAAVGIATGILTLLILIFGEITPKTMATISAEKIAFRFANIIYYYVKILTPVIFIVNQLSMIVLKLFRVDPNQKKSSITENELKTIVDVGHEEGVIESEERTMIYNVFDFGDSAAKDVMVPRIDMVCAEVGSSYQELIDLFKRDKYTRIPIYKESTDNVIGIINIKDLLLFAHDEQAFDINRILREAYYTYEHKKTSELMIEMKKASINIAIVLDEYGATVGMITLEDLLEEIVGEIRDEYDYDEEDMIQMVKEREYVVDGMTKLDEVNKRLGINLVSEDYDSIAGLVIGLLDHLPKEGETVSENEIRFVVEKLDKKRIDKVRIFLPENK
jgi:putative hemolysin